MSSTLLEEIEKEFGLPQWEARHLIRSSPRRYKEFYIEKKNGTRRLVAQPARETKRLQSWMVEKYLKVLPVHDNCMAYVSGKGIYKNAKAHAKNSFLLKMDFQQFFPSIEATDFYLHMASHNPTSMSEQDLELAAHVLFWIPKGQEGLRLCIGAPSSPIISNTIAYDFDCRISEYCNERQVKYTRYADDLTFSTMRKNILASVEEKVRETLQSLQYPRLKVNEQKTIHLSKRFSRRVTGLVLTNDEKVSLGRDRKRSIRAQLHHFREGRLSDAEAQKLRGLLAFAHDVEPEFVDRMKHHYGAEVITGLMHLPFAKGRKSDASQE